MEQKEFIPESGHEIMPEKEEAKMIDWTSEALQESIERIKKNLEVKQKESQDEFFKKLKVRDLSPEALMILNISMEESGEPFPENVKKGALKIAMESPLYHDPKVFSDPRDRLRYIKELIVLYPNTFYKKKIEG